MFLKAAMAVSISLICFTLSAQERTLVTAHAGSCGTPDNSIESLLKAVSVGVDIVEMDIRQCPDGSIGLSHNEIKDGDKVVSLKDALLAVKPSGVHINLDIKEGRAEVFQAMYKMLKKYKMLDRVLMTGIQPEEMPDAQKYMPGVPAYSNFTPSTTLISNKEYADSVIQYLKASGSEGINCSYKKATPELAKLLKENGFKLSVWTVNEEKDMKRMLELEPYNITSRNPDVLKKLAGK